MWDVGKTIHYPLAEAPSSANSSVVRGLGWAAMAPGVGLLIPSSCAFVSCYFCCRFFILCSILYVLHSLSDSVTSFQGIKGVPALGSNTRHPTAYRAWSLLLRCLKETADPASSYYGLYKRLR